MTDPADVVLDASKALYSASRVRTSLYFQTADLLATIADAMTIAGATVELPVGLVTVPSPEGFDAVFTAAYDMARQIQKSGEIDVRSAPMSGRKVR